MVSATYQYARVRLTGQTMAAGKNAFAEALSVELNGAMKDWTVDLGRQLWGVGDGRLAQIATSATAATGSTIVPVFNRYASPGQPGARYISVGSVLDIGSVGNGITAVSQTVSAVSISSNPATTTDSITLGNSACTFSSSQQFLYNRGAGGSGGVGLEMLGLQAIVDDFTQANIWGSNAFWSASLLGIARSANSEWNASILANSQTARVVDGFLMQQAFDTIHQATGEEPDLIMGHHSVIRAFLDSVSSDRRYGSTDFQAGFSGLTYNGVRLERDRFAPYNSLLVAKKDALAKFTLKGVGWADRDGSVLSRVSDQDNWEAFLCYYGNLGVVGFMKSLCFIRDIKTDF